jgi:preprotein translocase subunit SecY
LHQGVIDRPSPFGLITNIVAITAGSMIALWLGELITEQKVGNGISLIILAGILSRLPTEINLAITAYTPYTSCRSMVYGAFLIVSGLCLSSASSI